MGHTPILVETYFTLQTSLNKINSIEQSELEILAPKKVLLDHVVIDANGLID